MQTDARREEQWIEKQAGSREEPLWKREGKQTKKQRYTNFIPVEKLTSGKKRP